MTSIHTELREIMDRIIAISDERYVQAMIGKPPIPVFFVHLLFLMMKSNQVPLERIHNYCIATSLLQMGLSTHEQVTTHPQLPPEEMRRRQLVVLSGDYYTSLFYRWLAEHQEIEGIHLLSKVISVINETKMTHYTSWQSYANLDVAALKRIQYIESGILTALADFFHVGEQSSATWKVISANLLFMDILSQHPEWIPRLSPESVIWIEECWNELREAVSRLEAAEVKSQLLQLMTQQQSILGEFAFSKKG